MMTAAEYRDQARRAHDRAEMSNDPRLTAELLDHARRWDRLATDADIQDQLVVTLSLMPPATTAR